MKIVSLSPSFTEILKYFGEEPSLVAVTDHCPAVRENILRIGSPKALDLEGIGPLESDWILAERNENRPEEIRELEKKKKVLILDVRSVQDCVDAVAALGRLTGKTEKSGALSREILEEKRINEKLFEEVPPVRALLLIWNQPYLSVNFDTYMSRLLESSGGYNIFRQTSRREFPVEMREMIEKNPEVMLLATDPFPFKKRHIQPFRKYRLLSEIPIELADGKIFSRFGPRTVDGLRTLRAIFAKLRGLEGARP